MGDVSVKEQIIQELDHLTPDQQAHLLSIARRLQQSPLPPGTPGEALIALRDQLDFPPGALDEMLAAIEEETERIDWNGWQ